MERHDATRSGIRILPSSVNWLTKLHFLCCRGCKDLIIASFHRVALSGNSLLDDCGLSKISDSLGSLKSLMGIYLDGNNLKTLPATIKQPPELRWLYIRDNRRLEYILELPESIEHFSFLNSSCLESLLSFTMNMSLLFVLDVRNCINLGRCWLENVLLGIENRLPLLRQFYKTHKVLPSYLSSFMFIYLCVCS